MKLMHLHSIYLGGEDGGKYVAASAAQTSLSVHLIEVLEDGATFSVLSGELRGGTAVDMTDAANNNLGARSYNTGDLVYAPYGGVITTYTCDKATQMYKLPNT